MLKSKCCQFTVWVYSGGEGTSFYVCDGCDMACDTITPLDINFKDSKDAEVQPGVIL